MTAAMLALTEATSPLQSYAGPWNKCNNAAEADPLSNFLHLSLASGRAKLTHCLGKGE